MLTSHAEIGEAGLVIRTPTKRPMKFPLALINRKIIDAGDAVAHKSVLVKLPVFVSVGTEPTARIVMPLVRESNGDAVAVKCPKLFDESVI